MDPEAVARRTLLALEERLVRLHVLIYGDLDAAPSGDTVMARLRSAEKKRDMIASRSSDARELFDLQKSLHVREQTRTGEDIPPGREAFAASVVLSHASQFKSMATQLSALDHVKLQDSTTLARLIGQIPRMLKAIEKGRSQEFEAAQLRQRSAELVSRWHTIGVAGMGAAVGEWEERMLAAEKSVRRESRRRQEDGGAVVG